MLVGDDCYGLEFVMEVSRSFGGVFIGHINMSVNYFMQRHRMNMKNNCLNRHGYFLTSVYGGHYSLSVFIPR